jgi:SAM-dependent methyltransferase
VGRGAEGAEPERFAERLAFLLSEVRPGERVLDVGCGEGAFAAAMAERGAVPVCVDVADEPLRRLRARFAQLTDVRRATAGEPLPLGDGEADAAGPARSSSTSSTSGRSRASYGAWCGRAVGSCSRRRATTARCSPGSPRRPRPSTSTSIRTTDHLRFFSERTLRMVLEDAGFEDVALRTEHGHLLAVAR